MFKPIQTILFATNLSENCRAAFDVAASMATRYQATLVLLHVVEKMPEYVEGRLRGLLGEKQYADMARNQADNARQTLIGKKSSNKLKLWINSAPRSASMMRPAATTPER